MHIDYITYEILLTSHTFFFMILMFLKTQYIEKCILNPGY